MRAIALAIFLTALAASAEARWTAAFDGVDPEIKNWFKSQHNSRGEWCCDHSDGAKYFGDYTLNADGSVSVEGETIPKEQVLTGPNPTGAAVWWRIGKRTYCFAIGSGA